MITLYDYQQKDKNNIYKTLHQNSRVLFQANTGYGKTVVLANILKDFAKGSDKKALVLVHRSELLDQTRNALIRENTTSEAINDCTEYLLHNSKIYVAMVQSLENRLEKDSNFIKDIGLIIIDECHIQVFEKVVKRFPDAKKLGFTATPVLMNRVKFWRCDVCQNDHDENTSSCKVCENHCTEFSKPLTMSSFYDDIVVGESIENLINRGNLCPEFPIVSSNQNLENLATGQNGDFTKKSLNEAFGDSNSMLNVLDNYKEYCQGKKTIIFNSSTKMNKVIYKQFKDENINVRMFDSVNTNESGKRSELLEWYENTPDAVLLNVGTFTTGFDEPTIEACILNTDTLSLSLYLQMVGRAGRSTTKIFKDKFILIDCGRNIERHGLWSDPTLDWRRIFFKGIGEERAVKKLPEGFETCEKCWSIFDRGVKTCPACGWEIPKPTPAPPPPESINQLAIPIREVPPPNAKAILKFVKAKKENVNFGFKVLISQIIDMFVFYRVTSELYQTTKQNGNLHKKIRQLIRPTYFALIKSDLKGANRTLNNIENRILRQLDKRYEQN